MQRKGCNFPVKINVKHAPSVRGSCFVAVTTVNMRHRALEIGAGIKYGDDMACEMHIHSHTQRLLKDLSPAM